MHNHVKAFTLAIFLTACATSTPIPTSTATPTATTPPTQSPTPSATPEPSNTPPLEHTPVETPQATPFTYPDVPTIYPAGAKTKQGEPRIGTGIIQDIALSPDAKTIAVGTTVGVYLYDTENFEEIQAVNTDQPVRQIKWSSDGSYIAVQTGRGIKYSSPPPSDFFLLDVNTGEKKFRQFDFLDSVSSLDWSPEANVIAVGPSTTTGAFGSSSKINELAFYNTETPNLVGQRFLEVDGEYASHVTFSPDGSIIGYIDHLSTVYLIDAQTGATQHVLEHDEHSRLSYLLFSPDGQMLAAYTGITELGGEQSVFVWNIQTGELLHTLTHEVGVIIDVTWSGDSTRLVSASWATSPCNPCTDTNEAYAIIWDIATGEPVHALSEDHVHDIALSPDNQHLIIAGYEYGSLSLWNTETGQLEIEYLGVNEDWDNPTFDPVWLPDQTFLVAANHALVHYGIESDKPLHILQTRPEGNTILWTQDGLRFAVTDHPDTGTLWDGVSGRFLGLITDNSEVEEWFAPSTTYYLGYDYEPNKDKNCYPDRAGRFCVSLKEETYDHPVHFEIHLSTIQIRDQQSRQFLWELTQAGVQADSFSFSPDGSKLAVGYGHIDMGSSSFEVWNVEENYIGIYDIEYGILIKKLYGHTGRIQDFAWSPDGTKLLSRSADGSIILWNWL